MRKVDGVAANTEWSYPFRIDVTAANKRYTTSDYNNGKFGFHGHLH